MQLWGVYYFEWERKLDSWLNAFSQFEYWHLYGLSPE